MLFADAAAAAGAAIATPLSFSIIVAQTYHSPTNYLPPPPYPRAPPLPPTCCCYRCFLL